MRGLGYLAAKAGSSEGCMVRNAVIGLSLWLLAACASTEGTPPLVDLGDFSLGHNVVIAEKAQKGPVSRDATAEEWSGALTSAIANRFTQYQGEQLYHFGVSVEGYMLAPPGVPLVYTPKSALIINVTVWDDAGGRKLNEEPHQITVLETTGTDSLVIGSGWGRTKEQQMAGLSFNAVRAIEKWMLEQGEAYGWFTEAERVIPKGTARPKPNPVTGSDS